MTATRWAPPVWAAKSPYKIYHTILCYVCFYFQFSQSFIFSPKIPGIFTHLTVYNHPEGGGSNLLQNVCLHDVVSQITVILKFIKFRGVTPCRYRQSVLPCTQRHYQTARHQRTHQPSMVHKFTDGDPSVSVLILLAFSSCCRRRVNAVQKFKANFSVCWVQSHDGSTYRRMGV